MLSEFLPDTEAPLLFDASTSVVARGKIIVAAQEGKPIPTGWAIDPEGTPTTDAKAALAGSVLPFGGPKGSAISLIIDVLCGVLTGSAFALTLNTLENLQAEQNLGHVFLAMRTDLFMTTEEFAARMDEILRTLKSSPPSPETDRVLAPGEIESQSEAKNRVLGIALLQSVVDRTYDVWSRVERCLPPCEGHGSAGGGTPVSRCNPEQTFNFFPIPTDIHFGYGVLAKLPECVRSLGAQRVFLITDPGIQAAGILQTVLDLLAGAQIGCEVYEGVKQDSGTKLISEAAERLRSEQGRRGGRTRGRKLARYCQGRGDPAYKSGNDSRLHRAPSGEESPASSDRDPNHRGYGKRSESLVGVHE